MHTISRREFCGKAATTIAAASFVSASVRGLFANPLGMPIGSQTYPHRQRIKDGDFAGLCRDMAASASAMWSYAPQPMRSSRASAMVTSQEDPGRSRSQMSEQPLRSECAADPTTGDD